jgi:DNA-directed RNA polymerase subunit F
LDRVILGKRYISLHEAREALESRIKSRVKVADVHERTWSYLSLFGTKGGEDARRAFEMLKKLGLNDETAVNLLNICPESEGEVRAVLVMERESVYDVELVNNILSILRRLCSS